MATYDVRLANQDVADDTPREEIRRIWQTNRPLFTVSYYRGRIYSVHGNRHAPTDDWITVFLSDDRQRMVFGRDFGPICFSEDCGTSWNAIGQPGEYECTLSTSPKGSVVVAALKLGKYTLASAADESMAEKKWYAAVSSADGSKLVLTGGGSKSAPALRITSSGSAIHLSWPSAFPGFVLQKNSELVGTNWVSVTNSATVIESAFVVSLPLSETNKFFRLEHKDVLTR